MPALQLFKESYVTSLRLALRTNLPKYSLLSSWAADSTKQSEWRLTTSLEPKSDLQSALLMPTDSDLKDLENTITLFNELPNLSRLQARDPRLWTKLTHVEMWSYMRARWPAEKHAKDPEKAARYVETHYFVPQAASRALLRNGVARLWWTAALTHDTTRDNPYELTGVLLSTLDITQQLLERSMGRSPVVVRTFLDFLLRNKDPLLQKGDENRARIRRLALFLNMYGGVCLLDTLSEADILRLLDAELKRVLSNQDGENREELDDATDGDESQDS